jgi:hypothetical protein
MLGIADFFLTGKLPLYYFLTGKLPALLILNRQAACFTTLYQKPKFSENWISIYICPSGGK